MINGSWRNVSHYEEGLTDEEEIIEDYDEIVWNAIAPNWLEYASLTVFTLLLMTGLVGNFLVMFVVLRNECMRTVTNYFLVNLALADFMVLLFCLPFTILWEITKTWWFGTSLCKIIVYWQTLSVSVSILTLTCISTERWHAICHPLSFKNTFKRTRISLVIIWLCASLLALPEMVILQAKPLDFGKSNYTSVYLTQCTHTWDDSLQQVYQLAQTLVLYIIPLGMMMVMYGHIAYVLWVKSIPPSDSITTTTTTSPPRSASTCVNPRRLSPNYVSNSLADYSPVSRSMVDRMTAGIECQGRFKRFSNTFTGRSTGGKKSISSHSSDHWKEREVMHRRKAAKMLIAVVVLFAICYLPTHLLNILRYFDAVPDLSLGLQRSAMLLSIRFMCYFNSCVNPIVYNFMSEKFQKEFQQVFSCFRSKYRPKRSNPSFRFANYEVSALLASGRNPLITHL